MNEVKVTEFRARLPSYLARVEAGETLTITSRGRTIARLIPVQDARAAARNELACLRGKCRIGDVVSPLDMRGNASDGDS